MTSCLPDHVLDCGASVDKLVVVWADNYTEAEEVWESKPSTPRVYTLKKKVWPRPNLFVSGISPQKYSIYTYPDILPLRAGPFWLHWASDSQHRQWFRHLLSYI